MLVTALLKSNTNIACKVGWLSAWLLVNMFLGIDGCQEHFTGTMKQEGAAELKQHPTKTLPCKMYYKWASSQTDRQQTQPAQPSQPNPASPAHPHSTQPASHPNMTNCHKLYGFPQGLGITVNSDVFAKRIKHRKNIRIWQNLMNNVRLCLNVYVFLWFLTKCKCL